MELAENIRDHVRNLPKPDQAQVLDFVAYLEKKLLDKEAHQEESVWSEFSLASAMADMEDEDGPEYTLADTCSHFLSD